MTAVLTTPCLDAGIVTNDLPGQTRFYGEALGLPKAGSVDIPGVGTIHRFAVGNSMLRLMVPAQPAASQLRGGNFAAISGIRYLAFRIANLTETVERIAEAGFGIAVPPRDLRPGVRIAIVEDSDGNAVELMEEAAS